MATRLKGPGLNSFQQLPLDLPQKSRLSRDDFIGGAANRAALQLVDSWPDWNGQIAIIWGPEGSGKSHIANFWLERAGGIRLTANQFADPETVAACLIEDADSQDIDETGLFHVLNRATQTGASLLITARTPPASWGLALPDLNSRLSAATIARIEAPDDTLLSAVLAKQFSDRQLLVEANVISYLVERMERSLAAATAIVDALDRLSLERQARITRSLAAIVVNDANPLQGELDI